MLTASLFCLLLPQSPAPLARPAAKPEPAARPPAAAPGDVDTDGDGLSDFDELHKYLTDPTKADSDGDGIPDGDPDERREYAYTIRSVVDVCPPVTEEFLTDDFQDARVLERTEDHVRLEVVHYPFSTAQAEIPADPDWRVHVKGDPGLARWLKPGPTANFDDAMRAALTAALAKDGIDAATLDDRTLVQRTARWLLDHTRFEDGFTTYTATFEGGAASVLPGLRPAVDRELKKTDRTLDQQWSRELFADGMFRQRVHGTCTSTAILWDGVFRALGIPTRIVLMLPVIDRSDPDEVALLGTAIHHHRVRALLQRALPPSDSWTNHTFDEVFVGGRWRRLNYATLGQGILDAGYLGLMTHVATVSDWADGEFAKTYGRRELLRRDGADAFGHANPYSCVELSDRFGAHATVDNPEVPEHATLTIDRLYWWSSTQRKVEMRLDDPAHAGHLLFHVKEVFPDQDSGQFARFYDAVDHDFVLRADGHPDVPARATRGFWADPGGETRDFYLRVEPGDVDRIALHVPYALVPRNAKAGRKWAVAPNLALQRATEREPFAEEADDGPRRTLTLDVLSWSDDETTPKWIRDETKRANPDGPPLLLGHVAKWKEFSEIRELTTDGDDRFFLEADGCSALSIRVSEGGITMGSGAARSAWVVFPLDPAQWRGLAPGVSYRLRPQNGKAGFTWKVADGALVPPRR